MGNRAGRLFRALYAPRSRLQETRKGCAGKAVPNPDGHPFGCVVPSALYLYQCINNIHAGLFENPAVFLTETILVILPLLFLSTHIKGRVSRFFVFMGRNSLFYYAFSGVGRIIVSKLTAVLHLETGAGYILSLICVPVTVLVLWFPAKLAAKLKTMPGRQ